MLRALGGPFFAAAGALHFVRPRPYEAIVPDNPPAHPERYRVPGGRTTLLLRLPARAAFVAWVRAAAQSSSPRSARS